MRSRVAVLLSVAYLASFGVALAFGVALSVVGADKEEHARSDRFWATTHIRAMSAETYESLDDIALGADAIIVGRIQSVQQGRDWDAERDESPKPVVAVPGEPVTPRARFAEVIIVIEQTIGSLGMTCQAVPCGSRFTSLATA